MQVGEKATLDITRWAEHTYLIFRLLADLETSDYAYGERSV
jgi:hypothetical protein